MHPHLASAHGVFPGAAGEMVDEVGAGDRRAGGGDQAVDPAARDALGEALLDLAAEPSDRGVGGRVPPQVGGAAERSQGEADDLVELARLGGDPLGAAAAHVDDDGGARPQVHDLAHGAVDEPPLLQAGEELDVEAGEGLDPGQEVGAVGGLAHGAGGHGHHALHPPEAGEGGHLPQSLEAVPHGGLGEGARAQAGLAEAHHLALAAQQLVAAAGRRLGHHHVDGVRSDVDGRQPLAAAGGVRRISGSWKRQWLYDQGRRRFHAVILVRTSMSGPRTTPARSGPASQPSSTTRSI